jgi:hypothetical protein
LFMPKVIFMWMLPPRATRGAAPVTCPAHTIARYHMHHD